MIVDNLKLMAKLKKLEADSKSQDGASVVVGYQGQHVLRLHEMTPVNLGTPRRSGIGSYWGPSLYGNQWLLGPARQYAGAVADTVRRGMATGKGLLKALASGGGLIQRESVRRVPKETGLTAQSSFVEEE